MIPTRDRKALLERALRALARQSVLSSSFEVVVAVPDRRVAAQSPTSTRAEMIRVVHYLDSAAFGGSEQALLQLMGALDRRRWHQLLLHHESPGLGPLIRRADALGLERRVVPGSAGWPGLPYLPSLHRALRHARADVFHAHLHWPLACTGGILAARAAGVGTVVATVQLAPDLPRGALIALQRMAATAAVDRYVAVSSHVAAAVRRGLRVAARHVTVVHNGIDPCHAGGTPSATSIPADDGRPRVLTVARLARQKALGTLIAAAATLPEAVFWIAGEGPLRADLERELHDRALTDRVHLLGWRDDVPALIAAADLFVLPSVREGLPLALLEAMAAAKPIVASAIGGIDEVVEDGVSGVLLPPGDSDAIAAAIRSLLRDPERALAMGLAGRDRVLAHFTAAATATRIGALYDELLAERGR